MKNSSIISVALLIAGIALGLLVGHNVPIGTSAQNPDVGAVHASYTAPAGTVGTEEGDVSYTPACAGCFADYLRFQKEVESGHVVILVSPTGGAVDIDDLTTNTYTGDSQYEGTVESWAGDPVGFMALAPDVVSYYFSNGGYAFDADVMQAGTAP